MHGMHLARNFKTFSDVTATAKKKMGQLNSEMSPKSRVGIIRNLETEKLKKIKK